MKKLLALILTLALMLTAYTVPALAESVLFENDDVKITTGGLSLVLPPEYYDLVTVETPDDAQGILFAVSETASLEAGDFDGAGWLFSIGKVSADELHEMLCYDMSGAEVLAKGEDGSFYMYYHPTDVRYARATLEEMYRDQDQWTMLCDWAGSVQESFSEINGLEPAFFGNTEIDMYVARAAWSADTDATLSTTEFGPVAIKGVDGSPYAESVLQGGFFETDPDETPDGQYVVLNFPEEDVRLDFFFAPGSYVRTVSGDRETLYQAMPYDEGINCAETMQSWYYAAAELAGIRTASMAEGNIYRDLLLAEEYGENMTYVIGHKSPDSDTVGSAIAYAYLLNAIGVQAEPAISGPVNNETAYALAAFGMEPPQIIDRAAGKQFILVDHSACSQAIDGMENARIVGIVDHHGSGDVTSSEMINIRSAPVGATATLVFQMYRECEVEIPRDMARVMLMSILSDTRNMTKNVTELDRVAYSELQEIAETEVNALYQGMVEAKMSYEDMTDGEIFLSDYKEYEEAGIRFGIARVDAVSEENARQLADRMMTVMGEREEGLDMLFTIVKNQGEGENLMYMVARGDGAVDVLQSAFGNYDEEKYFVFQESLSRKKDVVPAITEVLKREKISE